MAEWASPEASTPDAPAATALFQLGDFRLASGGHSRWKIECDALTDEDWAALAAMLMERVPPFCAAYGVPTGGLPLAALLDPHGTRKPGDPALVVDDVWTTGGSMRRFIRGHNWWNIPRCAVVFARNPVPDHVVALFTMTPSPTGAPASTSSEGAPE